MIAVEAVAVHLDMLLLFIVLLVLALFIMIIGGGLLSHGSRRPAPRKIQPEIFEDVLRAVEAAEPPRAPPIQERGSNSSGPSFGVGANQSQKAFETPVRNAAPKPPEKVAFSTIQHEIRAALGSATRDTTIQTAPDTPVLQWLEPGRLAILSLGHATPESAWSVLQTWEVNILVTPEAHPFPTPNRALELLCLPNRAEAIIPVLAVKLRAKLAKGERIAFYGTPQLTGSVALLADQLASQERR